MSQPIFPTQAGGVLDLRNWRDALGNTPYVGVAAGRPAAGGANTYGMLEILTAGSGIYLLAAGMGNVAGTASLHLVESAATTITAGSTVSTIYEYGPGGGLATSTANHGTRGTQPAGMILQAINGNTGALRQYTFEIPMFVRAGRRVSVACSKVNTLVGLSITWAEVNR